MTDEEKIKEYMEMGHINLSNGCIADGLSVKRFAELIRADEREKVAQWMIQIGYATGHGNTTDDLLAELGRQFSEDWTKSVTRATATEREACAQVCEDHFSSDGDWCAKQIRARGEK
jgi:hypothetical protein